MKAFKFLLVSLAVLSLAIPVIATRPVNLSTSSSLGVQSRVHTSQLTISVRFLANGTIEVLQGSKQIASGIPTLQGYTPSSTTGQTLSTTHGTITQAYAANNINVVYDCVLSGIDLTITAHITNNGASAIGKLILVTPSFTFSTVPTGTMPSWHSSYLATQGLGAFHPSCAVPIGCVYAGDSHYSVAAWSASELAQPSLIQASFVYNNQLPNPLPVELHTVETIAPKASLDISITLRITTDTTPAGILSGYKALLPPMSYTPVAKPATAFQSIDLRWVTPTNPFGYNGDSRRIDLPQGVTSYLTMVTPKMKNSSAIGVIFWAPGGYQTTSMYPIDFDVNLNRISATWPSLVQKLQAYGFRAGICARFGDVLNTDGTTRRADPANANDVATMLNRVDAVTNTGVDMWYVDSVCNDWPSTQMTAIAKKHLPSNHLFFTEYATDVSLAFAGAYCEWTGAQTHWLTEQQRAQLLELYPKSTWLCMDRSGKATPAQLTALGFEPLTGD